MESRSREKSERFQGGGKRRNGNDLRDTSRSVRSSRFYLGSNVSIYLHLKSFINASRSTKANTTRAFIPKMIRSTESRVTPLVLNTRKSTTHMVGLLYHRSFYVERRVEGSVGSESLAGWAVGAVEVEPQVMEAFLTIQPRTRLRFGLE